MSVDALTEDNLSESVVYEVITEIIDSWSNALDEKERQLLEIPQATELAMLKLKKLIELAILPHDGDFKKDDVFEKFTPDGEPYPSAIDSWARGTGIT